MNIYVFVDNPKLKLLELLPLESVDRQHVPES